MKRIQLENKAGWRKPENSVCVDYPSKFANPFMITDDGFILYRKPYKIMGSPWCYFYAQGGFSVENMLDLYERWLDGDKRIAEMISREPPDISELKGKDIVSRNSINNLSHVDILISKVNELF